MTVKWFRMRNIEYEQRALVKDLLRMYSALIVMLLALFAFVNMSSDAVPVNLLILCILGLVVYMTYCHAKAQNRIETFIRMVRYAFAEYRDTIDSMRGSD